MVVVAAAALVLSLSRPISDREAVALGMGALRRDFGEEMRSLGMADPGACDCVIWRTVPGAERVVGRLWYPGRSGRTWIVNVAPRGSDRDRFQVKVDERAPWYGSEATHVVGFSGAGHRSIRLDPVDCRTLERRAAK